MKGERKGQRAKGKGLIAQAALRNQLAQVGPAVRAGSCCWRAPQLLSGDRSGSDAVALEGFHSVAELGDRLHPRLTQGSAQALPSGISVTHLAPRIVACLCPRNSRGSPLPCGRYLIPTSCQVTVQMPRSAQGKRRSGDVLRSLRQLCSALQHNQAKDA